MGSFRLRRVSRLAFLPLSTLFLSVALLAPPAGARRPLTSPKEALGFEIGDDYQLATYTQLTSWWKALAAQSDRMSLVDIGPTEEGRPQWMAILTSPRNHRNLARYRDISRRLALGEIGEEQARALARQGKAVVWIDGGLHATEVLGAHQLMQMVWEMVSRNDPETLRILDDTIILAVHANPDGMELVSRWYMRESDPTKRRSGRLPTLFQKYIGHDNNRDFYASNMKESTNVNRQLYLEWFPQIVYNHHQSGPAGTVLFAPPFRDPFNYNLDPLVPAQISLLGSLMHDRFIKENKPGATMRNGGSYSTWYNGGLRTTAYFHNMVGILTEMIGNPTPTDIPLVPDRQLPAGDLPFPVAPQKWHFRQSIEYSMTANRAILDYASRYREEVLFNAYRMAKNSIQRGSQDSWSITPKSVALLKETAAAQEKARRPEAPPAVAIKASNVPNAANASRGGSAGGASNLSTASAAGRLQPAGLRTGRGGRGAENAGGEDSDRGDAPTPAASRGAPVPTALYASVLHNPTARLPRGYIIPSDQPDFPTATKFINALLKTGVAVHRASAPFTVAGRSYPADSWVVKTAQAFRPHILDMFEPQDYPDDFRSPGGPPIPPYDITGYTLAYQMGVKFDRILEPFTGPFERVTGLQSPPRARVAGAGTGAGYLISHALNDGFTVVNRLLKAGSDVYWLKTPVAVGARAAAPGAVFVPSSSNTRTALEQAAAELGVGAEMVERPPGGEAFKLQPVRIGLSDRYGGSIPSGWLRWLFERFEFPHQVIYPPELDAGHLTDHYDVLVLPDGALTAGGGGGGNRGNDRGNDSDGRVNNGNRAQAPAQLDGYPPEYRNRVGRLTAEKTVPQLRAFLEAGGTVVAIGSSTGLAQLLGLPIKNGLTEKGPGGQERPLPREKFYVPGSVLRVSVDNSRPIAYGMAPLADVFFENSEVFRLPADAAARGIRPVAWFASPAPLRSGWAWGQSQLNGTVAVAEATVGRGKLFLLGVEAAFRAQPHGTFKLLFNAIQVGPAKVMTLEPVASR